MNTYNFLRKRNKDRIVLIYGGVIAGKSYGVSKYLVEKAEEQKHNFVVVRSSQYELKYSAIPNLMTLANSSDWKLTKTKNRLVYKNGSVIECRTPKEIDTNYDEYFWDEANLCEYKDFKKLTKNGRHIAAFNPPDKKHWLNKIRKLKSVGTMQTNYKDNKYINELDEKILKEYKNIDKNYYNTYVLGVWDNN